MKPVPESAQIIDLFRAHGLRHTRQRELIYRALAASDEHPAAETLLASVRALEPGLSLATVYNALDAFVEVGLCRRLHGPSEAKHATAAPACRFDAKTHEHVHLEIDGELLDAPEDVSDRVMLGLTPSLLREIEHRMGVSVARVSVQIVANREPRPLDARRPD